MEFYPVFTLEKRGGFSSGWIWPHRCSNCNSHQQNQTLKCVLCSRTGLSSPFHAPLARRAGIRSFSAPSFGCWLFLRTFPFLPADLQASFQVRLPEAGACGFAPCGLLVGRELWTAELAGRITIGGHCWTLTNIVNTQVVAVGLFFKFTLIKISFIFKT